MKTLLFANQLHGFKALSTNGDIGHVDEFYFDDQSWKIRYCVIDVGTWLSDRKVLISPAAIGGIDWKNKGLIIKATKDQIQKSPDASTELPIARVLEAQIHKHYGWEYYWPEMFTTQEEAAEETANSKHDPHLRSTKVLTNISVSTDVDADIGAIDDFLINSESWNIPFVEVNRAKTGRMLLSAELIQNIDVTTRKIRIASPWQGNQSFKTMNIEVKNPAASYEASSIHQPVSYR
jgi:hypothetical protein